MKEMEHSEDRNSKKEKEVQLARDRHKNRGQIKGEREKVQEEGARKSDAQKETNDVKTQDRTKKKQVHGENMKGDKVR